MTFLGLLSDPFQWLSDLQLGDEKITLNHLDLNLSETLGLSDSLTKLTTKIGVTSLGGWLKLHETGTVDGNQKSRKNSPFEGTVVGHPFI